MDGHDFTEFVNVTSKPMSNSLGGIGKTELFNSDSVAVIAPDFAVINMKPDLAFGYVQIPNHAKMPIRMHSAGLLAALMADRAVPSVRGQLYKGRTGIFMVNRLFCNFYSHKREILCYTKTGHCATPFMLQVLMGKKLISRKAA